MIDQACYSADFASGEWVTVTKRMVLFDFVSIQIETAWSKKEWLRDRLVRTNGVDGFKCKDWEN
jgi:hypothetical protein